MADPISAPRTGVIKRDTVSTIDELGLRSTTPVIDSETSTLAAKAEANTVQLALDEGQHVSNIESMLMTDRGMEQQDARNLLLDALQPAVSTALEEHSEDALRQVLVSEYAYPEDLVTDLFSGRQAYQPPALVDVAEDAPVPEEELSQLTTLAQNVHELQMPMLKGLKARIFEDPAGMAQYKQLTSDTTYAIANTLRRLGKNVEVDDRGELIDVETGQAIDTSFLDAMAAAEGELIGAIGGAATGAKLATTAVGMTPWGRFAKLAGTTIGAITGSAAGSSLGRSLDVISNAMQIKEQVDANFVLERMKDAGVFAATSEIIGTPMFYAGAKMIKGIGRGYDLLIEGNKEGAYRALKDLMHLDDMQVDEIIKTWEKATGAKAPGVTRAKKALSVIPQTEPGGEAIIRSAAGLNPRSSSAIARSISDRAKDLGKATDELTNENIGVVLNDELGKYQTEVKDFYTGIKAFATDSMEDVSYSFDYNKLALDPIMERINVDLTNQAVKERFGHYVTKIQSLGGDGKQLRSFDDLLELRKTINEFKSVTRIRNQKDFDAVNSVIAKIDGEVAKVAKEQMPNGETWLKGWKQANTEYSKMFKLRENVLFKSLTKKGIDTKKIVKALTNNITSIDGTFMQVIAKLPQRARASAEGAVIDALTKKHTIGFESGLQATHFTNLAEELKHVGFTTPKVRELKRAVGEMAKVFKNDVELSRATGQVSRPNFQSYLTTDPVVRAKYEVASTAFNYIKRLLPTGKGDTVALVTNVAKLMENPQNSKAIKDLLKSLPNDPELASSVRRLALEYAKFGKKDISPKVQVFRTGTPGTLHKAKEGPLGKGIYWTTSKAAARKRSRTTGGKVITEKILPSRIAVEQNIKDALGIEDFDPSMLKGNKELVELLKDRGYEGVSFGDDVIIFK